LGPQFKISQQTFAMRQEEARKGHRALIPESSVKAALFKSMEKARKRAAKRMAQGAGDPPPQRLWGLFVATPSTPAEGGLPAHLGPSGHLSKPKSVDAFRVVEASGGPGTGGEGAFRHR